MKGFLLGFIAASILGAGLVWAQSQGYTTDPYGHVNGYFYGTQPAPQQNWMAPAQGMGQQLQGILNNQRSPC